VFNALSDVVIFCRIERRLADLTCKAYERDVRACLDFMRSQGISALIEIRTPDLRRFLAEEATHRPAPSSQARTVAALRCFFRFCVESDYLERDPAHVRDFKRVLGVPRGVRTFAAALPRSSPHVWFAAGADVVDPEADGSQRACDHQSIPACPAGVREYANLHRSIHRQHVRHHRYRPKERACLGIRPCPGRS
jgi:hypothetical protein